MALRLSHTTCARPSPLSTRGLIVSSCRSTTLHRGTTIPAEVRFEIEEQDVDSYLRAADFLNFANTDIVSLQHEYGIFGGPAGSHVVRLLRDLRMPIVTTLHTVLKDPSSEQRRVLCQIGELSARMVVMSERAGTFLREVYGMPEAKIDLIAHGIPDMPFVDPNFYKDQFAVEGKFVALTFGLLSPNKGIERMLRAMPAILREYPNFFYIVLGATHPESCSANRENAIESVSRRLAKDLGIKPNVSFYNRFVEIDELIEFIGMADIYITPYLNPAQITSGTLAYAFGCGKAVVSTPYWYAEELLAEGRGVLVPFDDSAALAREICELLRDEPRRHSMRKKAYMLGREMIWSHVAHLYMESFQRARRNRLDTPYKPLAVRTLAEKPMDLPSWRLDQLVPHDRLGRHAAARQLDNPQLRRGLLHRRQRPRAALHRTARAARPEYRAGKPPRDDLRRVSRLRVRPHEKSVSQLSGFRSALGRGGRLGRLTRPGAVGPGGLRGALAAPRASALGVAAFRPRAADDHSRPHPHAPGLSAILGVCLYLERFGGARPASQMRDTLTERLIECLEKSSSDDWPWFEQVLSYDNAKLPHALIASSRSGGNPRALSLGLQSLGWLIEQQKSPTGCFRPIGSNGFYHRGRERAAFRPAARRGSATVAACIEAYHATDEAAWLQEARLAFEWFLGANDLGLDLYDSKTGGCHDGLQEDRVNANQGAESTLAFLLALGEMKLLESTLATFRQMQVN